MTPYQTPYQSGQTPRFSSNQQHPSSSGGFLHPGAVTPGGYKTPQQRSSQHQSQQHRASSSRQSGDNHGGEGPLDWRKAAEAYARSSQQKGVQGWPSQSRSVASSVVARYGGAGSVFGGPPKMPSKSPATTRNAAQVIHEGIQKVRNPIPNFEWKSLSCSYIYETFSLQTKQLSSAHNYIQNKSPRSGRESLKSTPRTNFSPRSMVESCGDETPLHDEN